MKQVLFAIILAVGVFTLSGNAPATLLSYEHDPEEPVAHTLLSLPEIIGPQTVVVGELARLEVKGDKVAWECVPTINDGQAFGENNQKFVCSFRKRGLYTIVAAVYRNEAVEIMKFPIQVGVATPDVPVVVIPDVVVIEAPVDDLLVAETIQWCKLTTSDKEQCHAVSTVFDVVVFEIESNLITDAATIIERTAELNGELEITKLGSLMGKIQAYLTQEADAGRLDSVKDHLIVWKSISKGLTQYASLP